MTADRTLERSVHDRSGRAADDREPEFVRVLLIEDSRGDARLLVEQLRGGRTRFEVSAHGSLAEAFAAPEAARCDLVLADLGLPDSDGLDTFRACRAHWTDTPIVVLSGLGDETVAQEAVRAGAQDYLVKGEFDERTLQRALHYALGRHRVAEERRALTRELESSRKLEAVGQVAAGVAHEINTPLHYVVDNLRFLRRGVARAGALLDALVDRAREGASLDPEQLARMLAEADLEYLRGELPRCIEQSLEGLGRVGRIVEAMSDLAHPGGGDAADFVPTDLNRVIEGVIAMASCEWRGVAELRTELDPELPPVACLPGELDQALLNLVINAAQAVAQGGGDDGAPAWVELRSARTDDGHVEISVADSGPGVPEHLRTRVFEPFFTTKAVGAGTGQGLAIAHRVIVARHAGTIHVEDGAQGGAVFRVRLPLRRASTSVNVRAEE